MQDFAGWGFGQLTLSGHFTQIPSGKADECNREWLLKNSLARNPQKFHRARMPYKRRSRFWWTLSIPRLGRFFQKRGFFNSHAILRQLFSEPSSFWGER